jgi:hypothetical protein
VTRDAAYRTSATEVAGGMTRLPPIGSWWPA